eukprot:28510-Eustigmatos_ZCMA.PRE.1
MTDDEKWDAMFDALKSYIHKHGTLPKRDDEFIGRWLDKQKAHFKNPQWGIRFQYRKQRWEVLLAEHSDLFLTKD